MRLVRRGCMALCAKGGHNNESHNHNDVGSFMLYVDGEPEIVDAGNMIYTAKTFSSERYTLWNVRAAYHNLPLIGGREQLAAAYDEQAGVETCRRTLILSEDALRLEDSIELIAAQDVTWVFMLRHKPEITRGSLKAGRIHMTFDEALTPAAEEIPVTDGRMAGSFPGSLWRVLLTAGTARAHRQTFVVRRG